jgi:hypothetical protein
MQTAIFKIINSLYFGRNETWESECIEILESRKSIEHKEIACMALVCSMTDGKIEERIKLWPPMIRSLLVEYLHNQSPKDLNQSISSKDGFKFPSSRTSHLAFPLSHLSSPNLKH